MKWRESRRWAEGRITVKKYRITDNRHWLNTQDLFVDERCIQAILDFLSATDAGRIVALDRTAGNVMNEALELEFREWEEQEGGRRRRDSVRIMGVRR